MITIYALCYNEELMLPHFIKHYKTMFQSCKIVILDNESVDGSQEIALDEGCEVRTYKTNDQLNDRTYLELKNSCWKNAETDWVAIVDMDEHLMIHEEDLKTHNESIITFWGYNMVNMQNNLDIESIDHAVRAPSYDKYYLFNKSKISEINYDFGCHRANPIGDVSLSKMVYTCKHYKYINPDYMVNRHKMFAQRMSKENRMKGYGLQYLYPERKIRAEFEEARKNAFKLY